MVKEQLTLRFGWGDNFSFDNFYAAGNEAVIACLQQAAQAKGEQFVFVWGSAGSGKSHLLQAACQTAAELGRTVAYLPLAELVFLDPGIFNGLEQLSLVCIDDLQDIAGQSTWEDALFHLYNRMRETGSVLLVAATLAPAGLPIELADLRSRLSWGPVFRLQELADCDKTNALRMRAHARGFELPAEVAEFLMRHSARDTASLFALLDRLDQASLAQHRKLTIPFVRSLI